MSYDETTADRIRQLLDGEKGVTERKMFGGLSFMLNGNMCCGVLDTSLVLRLCEETLSQKAPQVPCHLFRMIDTEFSRRFAPFFKQIVVQPKAQRTFSTVSLALSGMPLRSKRTV